MERDRRSRRRPTTTVLPMSSEPLFSGRDPRAPSDPLMNRLLRETFRSRATSGQRELSTPKQPERVPQPETLNERERICIRTIGSRPKPKRSPLEAYARVRDDTEAQRQFAGIRLRACIRIGELSRDLAHGKPGPKAGKNQLSDTDVAQFDKENVLERSGIELRTAERYWRRTPGLRTSPRLGALA